MSNALRTPASHGTGAGKTRACVTARGNNFIIAFYVIYIPSLSNFAADSCRFK